MDFLKKNIAILGSTGSIGTQALEIIDKNPERFKVILLTANNNYKLLIEQAVKFKPNKVVIANPVFFKEVKFALQNYKIEVFSGIEAIANACNDDEIDIVLTAMVGFSGLIPTIEAIKKGKRIALANKETLVVAGALIMNLAKEYNSEIIPVDSEHSAIFQCINGEDKRSLSKIILTASGGPFFSKNIDFIKNAKSSDALNHPIWKMGNKVTIDSASMMNKGLEAIEAKWLFDLNPEQIEVVIHPQSIIHSMVEFQDGSIKAQLSVPDMKLPIQYAFTYPERIISNVNKFNFFENTVFNFHKPDLEKFPNLKLALNSIVLGGNIPCILNAANEIVVEAFLKNKIKFYEMSDLIENSIAQIKYIEKPDLIQLIETDKITREFTLSQII